MKYLKSIPFDLRRNVISKEFVISIHICRQDFPSGDQDNISLTPASIC